jgi:hypothetical protein
VDFEDGPFSLPSVLFFEQIGPVAPAFDTSRLNLGQ